MQFETDYKLSLQNLTLDTLLLCGDPVGERYSIDRVHEALNDVALDFCLKAQLIKQTANIVLQIDQIFYDVKTFCEESVSLKSYGFPIRLTFDGQNNPAMWPSSLAEIDLFSDSQITQTGPYTWHIDSVSPGGIVIYGRPSQEGYDPTTFTMDSDYLLLRQITQEGDYMPYDANEALRDIDGPVSLILHRDSDGNIIRLLTGISEDSNLQVMYIAFPDYMTGTDTYPDTIPAKFHDALPYGAASDLLMEGNQEDFRKAIEFDYEFSKQIRNAIAENYRGDTQYDSVLPV